MNEKLVQLQQKIDALNQRERILLLLTALVLVVILLQIVLIDPVSADRNKAQQNINVVTEQLRQQENEIDIVNAQLLAGINRNKIKQKNAFQKELDQLNINIEASVVAMIPPQLMAQVLEEVLAKSRGLRLLSLENKPVVALIEQQQDEQQKKQVRQPDVEQAPITNQALYSHGFILRLSGSYMSAIEYFDSLSDLPWRFYWDDLRYQVESYPNAIITLEVHTVSMSEEWIGV